MSNAVQRKNLKKDGIFKRGVCLETQQLARKHWSRILMKYFPSTANILFKYQPTRTASIFIAFLQEMIFQTTKRFTDHRSHTTSKGNPPVVCYNSDTARTLNYLASFLTACTFSRHLRSTTHLKTENSSLPAQFSGLVRNLFSF